MPGPDPADASIVDAILELFATRGAREYMGEAVSMSQHMEQSAACAAADGAPDSLVAASLLHDIGHFVGQHPIEALENGIDNFHETVGADYLGGHFPPAVIEMVSVAEEANTLETVLTDIADSLERQTWRRLDLMVRLVEPVMLLVMASIVLVVVIALLLPVMKMSMAI